MTLTTRRHGSEAGDSVRTGTSQGTLRTGAGSPSEAGTEAGVAVALSAEAPALGQLRVPEDGGPATCRRQPAAVLGPPAPRPPADSGGGSEGRWPCPRTASPACQPRRGRFQGRRPTASCGGPVGTVTCRPAEASPGKVGPRRPRAGPRLARLPPRWPRPGRPRVPPSVPPSVPPPVPLPAPAPACAAGSGFAGEAGAGVGRRRRIWPPPLQTGGSPRPWRTAGSFVSAAPVAPAGGVMVPGADAHCRGHRPALPQRPRLAERLGVRAPAPPSKAGEGAGQDRPGRPGARRVALKC